MEELFKLGEAVLEGKLPLEALRDYPERRPRRVPVENPFKRSALIVSADRLRHLKKAFLRPADVLIFNLEDGVSDSHKPFARLFLRKFLLNTDFDGSKEVVVRVNAPDSPYYWDDLTAILPAVPHAIRLSKVRSVEDVITLDKVISAFERSRGVQEGFIKIQLSVETPQAVKRLSQVVAASPRVNAVYLGILDLFAELGVSQRLTDSHLARYLKCKFVFEARSFRVYPIGPAYQQFEDLEGFEREALEEKSLGFAGKMCISVKQVEIANKVFSPSEEELREAEEIVKLYEEALKEGRGGVTYKGLFIDQPIYKDALNKLRFSS
jgi:citrate lyase subunit beta/citryl-CoA lyase